MLSACDRQRFLIVGGADAAMSAVRAAGVRMTSRSLSRMEVRLVRVPCMIVTQRFVAGRIVTYNVVQPQRQRTGAGDEQCNDSDSVPK